MTEQRVAKDRVERVCPDLSRLMHNALLIGFNSGSHVVTLETRNDLESFWIELVGGKKSE